MARAPFYVLFVQIIHVVADGFAQMFVLAGLLLGIPVVGSFHTDIVDLLATHNAFWFQKLLVVTKEVVDNRVLDSSATTSISFAEKLRQRSVHTEHTIITSVNTDVFCAAKRSNAIRKELMFGDTSGILCVYVGRISNEKRMDVIIEAMRNVTGRRAAYLALIGDGPSAALYAKGHGKANRLYCKPRFLTHEELAEVYASSDMHVTASEFETLGNTVLEAYACSIPVVAPRTQGFRDTVRHGIDGFLFHAGDSADATK
jgi:phosphatidylinositol alpha 1,6-mannosyltransferase